MTGSSQIQLFNTFFCNEYNYLLGFTKSINPRSDYQNLLQECYIKCHKRITLSGFSGTTFLNFVRVTIMNAYKTQYRDTKHLVDISDVKVQDSVEELLLDKYEYEQQLQLNDSKNVYLNTLVYEYVEKYYSEKEYMIFKTYYVLKHKHLNYQQLSAATGYSVNAVSKVIKRIKKDLRQNLKQYILTGSK